MNRPGLRAAGAALVAVLVGCAGARRPGRAPVPSEAPAPARTASFASTLEARAAMLMLEDERRFDAAALAAAAGSPDPAVRTAAAHAAGAIGDPRGRPLLVRLAGDGDSRVRAAAALGLEIARLPEGSPAAEALLGDADAGVRCAAGRAVGALHTGAGEAALVAAIRADPRPCLLYALARYGDEPAAAAARELAAAPSADLRRAAVYAFARNPVAGSSAALARALTDEDGEAAAFAARGLGVLGDPASLPALLSALDRRETGVRTLALNAIGAIEEKGRTAIPRDRAARIVDLSRLADPSVATAALAALRWCADDREAFRALHAQAVSGAGRRRAVAFSAELAVLGDRGRARIADASASPDSAFRAAGAAALVFLTEDAAAGLRDAFLRDPSPRVREAAVGTFPLDAARRPAIAALLADPDPGVRSAVVDRLAESGDPAVVPPIEAAMRASRSDTIPDVALSCVRAAARLKRDPARKLLESAAGWPRGVVAREARRALIDGFGGDAAALAPAPYATGRVISDYEKILEDSEGAHRASVTTARGTFTIALDATAAPLTVANFEALARRKFFDGTKFDRVVPWFVVQGGDPTETLHGGPGYEIRDELVAGSYERGSVGMGLEGADTGGSQWFVTLSRQPHLDGRYSLFGRVITGQEVVDRLEQGDALLSVAVTNGGG
ncbi:MAG TPA: peptidylprolyl isomerase [Thermoanaerobaculia bacterium]|nr:peptidylprolyl isomerase [Thermoanaerobaculia bacterium]